MATDADILRRALAEANGGRTYGGTRYPAELRSHAATHTRQRFSDGVSLKGVAQELEVPSGTLRRWLEADRHAFRPVAVGMAGSATGDEGDIELSVTLSAEPPPPLAIDLLLALPRPKTLRRLLPAVASLGVKRIVLVNAAKVDKSYFSSPLLTPQQANAALREGLEQARDTVLPEFLIEPLFRPFVEDRAASLWPDGVWKLLAHPGPQTFGAAPPEIGRAVVAIGPDGGWVPFELELLAAQGFAPFSLGPRALRVDVATVAALAQIEQALLRAAAPG